MRWLAAILAASVIWDVAPGNLAAQSDASSSTSVASIETKNRGSQPSSYGERSHANPLSARGTWDLTVWANEAIGNSAYGDVGDVFVSMAGFRTGYVFARPDLHGRMRGTIEYFFDIIPVFVLTKPQIIYGGGFSPVGLKWNFMGRRQPFVDASVGGMLSTRNVPPGATSSFNFTANVRTGISLWSHPHSSITGNLGFWHLSNARMGRTNPSLNALQFGIEYHWFKNRHAPEATQQRQP